ncbi:LysR substrate-binding domain-containing protein [Roseibium porphyridii]|uniref:LysR substrate-binding domain-containing protein n=1 Tax=Roseibium porphyridii TaxID=2866279 RepID=A0ABY8F320_9HYPH|nr:LysR substrate-binding domain-containing protein [Roseibium sp. KMA01]WFE88412.1 LysR substrate-binding domain-containing protein [Roseibium sp. KMA01]
MMLSVLPQTFVTVVETGSITRAAEDMNLAKSAVSQNLKRLETQLDVKLAVRTTRRLSLTPAGKRYYQKCKELIALSRLAQTEMEAFGARPSGPITITAPHALIATVIAPAIALVRRQFPHLTPQVIADDKRLDLVAEGIDVSLTVGDLPDSSLKARRVGALRDVLCVAPELLDAAPSADDPAFMEWAQSLPYIAHVREPENLEHILQSQEGGNPIRLCFKTSFRSNTVEAIAALAREGLGVALLPDIGVVEDLRAKRLVPLFSKHTLEPTPVYALHAYEKLQPGSVRATIKAIETILASAVAWR